MNDKSATGMKRNKRGTRTGFTTGACAAAVAKAAARCIVQEIELKEITSTLPNKSHHTFELFRCEVNGYAVLCSTIKDGGDDPDCTHGAEIIAEVTLTKSNEIRLKGGTGVAVVTRPGLGLEVGQPAINSVPTRNIAEMVKEEIEGSDYSGAVVTISVPDGEERAKETLNARLGLIGGISILGTTGIVRPYSTAAFRASVVQAIDVANELGEESLVITTGGRSEQYAMEMFPELSEICFIQMGDFVGTAVRRAAIVGVPTVIIVGMIGKLSKMADGQKMTHAAGSKVNMELLAGFAEQSNASPEQYTAIREANTARHVMENHGGG